MSNMFNYSVYNDSGINAGTLQCVIELIKDGRAPIPSLKDCNTFYEVTVELMKLPQDCYLRGYYDEEGHIECTMLTSL